MNSMVEEQQQQKMRCSKNFSNKLQFRHTSCRQLHAIHSIERECSNNWHMNYYDLSISSHCTRRGATLRRHTLGPKSAHYLTMASNSWQSPYRLPDMLSLIPCIPLYILCVPMFTLVILYTLYTPI